MRHELFELIGLVTLLGMMVLMLYVKMVGEPACEAKGFAGVDSSGCYIIKDGVRTYELSAKK